MKCLEFRLPSGAAGMAAGMTKMAIKKKLDNLVSENKIGDYKHRTERYKFRVWLEKEQDYTVFFLMWETHNNPWHRPELTDEIYTEI